MLEEVKNKQDKPDIWKTNGKMAEVNPALSMITLNVSGLKDRYWQNGLKNMIQILLLTRDSFFTQRHKCWDWVSFSHHFPYMTYSRHSINIYLNE